jgi:hypothetical protein
MPVPAIVLAEHGLLKAHSFCQRDKSDPSGRAPQVLGRAHRVGLRRVLRGRQRASTFRLTPGSGKGNPHILGARAVFQG